MATNNHTPFSGSNANPLIDQFIGTLSLEQRLIYIRKLFIANRRAVLMAGYCNYAHEYKENRLWCERQVRTHRAFMRLTATEVE